MIKESFIFFVNLTILTYYYLNTQYKMNFELIKGIINGIYYIYWLSAKNPNKKEIKNNIKLGCETVFNTCKIKLNVHGYKMDNIPIIYVANHHSYLDSVILKYLLPNVHTIAKDDADKEFFLSNILKDVFDVWGVILYKRGNKKSGKKVRKLMAKHINGGGSILVYPEGKAIAIGGPKDFYPGSFEVAFNNKFLIQPITLKYETDITWGEKSKFSKKYHLDMITNINQCQKQINNVNVTFHPIINPNKFKSADIMKQYCEVIIRDEWINRHHYTSSSI